MNNFIRNALLGSAITKLLVKAAEADQDQSGFGLTPRQRAAIAGGGGLAAGAGAGLASYPLIRHFADAAARHYGLQYGANYLEKVHPRVAYATDLYKAVENTLYDLMRGKVPADYQITLDGLNNTVSSNPHAQKILRRLGVTPEQLARSGHPETVVQDALKKFLVRRDRALEWYRKALWHKELARDWNTRLFRLANAIHRRSGPLAIGTGLAAGGLTAAGLMGLLNSQGNRPSESGE